MGFAMSGRVFVTYAWLIENLRSKDVSKATSIMFFIDALGIFNSTLYFKYISKDWKYIYGMPLICLLVTAFSFAYENESPKYLYGVGEYE